MSRPVRVVLLCVLALFVAAPAAGQGPEGPEGRLALYKPPKKLGSYTHGDVIWGRKVEEPSEAGLAHLGRAVPLHQHARKGDRRVRHGDRCRRASRPKGGWPLDQLGPRHVRDRRQLHPVARSQQVLRRHTLQPQQNAWLKQGYAIASTDYEGLGTPGVHPYLVGRSEGRGVLDIARASRQVDHRVGRKLVIAGHSQGGHAALFAAALAPRWTPDLKFRGVATFAPASHLDEQADALPSLTAPESAVRRLPP